MSFYAKSMEVWAAFAAMAIYVFMRDRAKETLSVRIAKTASSALLAFAVAADVAPFVNGSEVTATILVMGFGLVLLDVLTGIAKDGEFIKEIIRKRFGGGNSK